MLESCHQGGLCMCMKEQVSLEVYRDMVANAERPKQTQKAIPLTTPVADVEFAPEGAIIRHEISPSSTPIPDKTPVPPAYNEKK